MSASLRGAHGCDVRRRSTEGFDASGFLFFTSQMRMAHEAYEAYMESAGLGIAQRLGRFVNSGLDQSVIAAQQEVARFAMADRSRRQRHASLFLLEELDLRLAENTSPRLTAINSGLYQLLSEIKSWRSFT